MLSMTKEGTEWGTGLQTLPGVGGKGFPENAEFQVFISIFGQDSDCIKF
jgi:hypothetical protein